MRKVALLSFTLAVLFHAPGQAQDKAVYQLEPPDAVLKEIDDRDEKDREAREELTEKIQKEEKAKKKKEKEEQKKLRFDLKGIPRPASPQAFSAQAFHFPPVSQYQTNTCWAFSTLSFLESEVYRQTKQKIRLSEMWVVYQEFLEKAKRHIATRGTSLFSEGSESNAVTRILHDHGAVPLEAYPGIVGADKRFDHKVMFAEMESFLRQCKEAGQWDEGLILGQLRLIMDRYLGKPPATFAWKGKTLTPARFLKEVLRLEPGDYVDVISTLSAPFWQKTEYKVPDNWWHSTDYLNVPLEDFTQALRQTLQKGGTAALGLDVSEPGYNGFEKIAVVPSFDLPRAAIDQNARELRFDNHTTEDDHGVHGVGWMEKDGEDWYLIKDSARAARKARPEGYLYYRGDYVRLKMLTYMVHKDFARDLLARAQSEARRAAPGK